MYTFFFFQLNKEKSYKRESLRFLIQKEKRMRDPKFEKEVDSPITIPNRTQCILLDTT